MRFILPNLRLRIERWKSVMPSPGKPKAISGEEKVSRGALKFNTRQEMKTWFSENAPSYRVKKFYSKAHRARKANKPIYGFYTTTDTDGNFYVSSDLKVLFDF